MRTSILGLLAIVGTASAFDLYPSKGFLTQSSPEWPPISIPFNAAVGLSAYTYNDETQQLESYQNISAVQYYSSDSNREVVIANAPTEQWGFTEMSFFMNCDTGLMTYKIPAGDYCQQVELGSTFNLKDLLTAAQDPNAGINQYIGQEYVDFAHHELHHFKLLVETPQYTNYEHLYFCPKTLALKFINIEGEKVIYGVEYMTERLFTDADFAPYDTCDAASEVFLRASGAKVLFPRFF